jgi:hypothetical protein
VSRTTQCAASGRPSLVASDFIETRAGAPGGSVLMDGMDGLVVARAVAVAFADARVATLATSMGPRASGRDGNAHACVVRAADVAPRSRAITRASQRRRRTPSKPSARWSNAARCAGRLFSKQRHSGSRGKSAGPWRRHRRNLAQRTGAHERTTPSAHVRTKRSGTPPMGSAALAHGSRGSLARRSGRVERGSTW